MSRLRLFVTLRQPWLWMIDEVGSKVEAGSVALFPALVRPHDTRARLHVVLRNCGFPTEANAGGGLDERHDACIKEGLLNPTACNRRTKAFVLDLVVSFPVCDCVSVQS